MLLEAGWTQTQRFRGRLDPVKVKNVSYDGIGTKEGRIHMERQNYDKLQTRKLKALKILKVCCFLAYARNGSLQGTPVTEAKETGS